MLNDSVDQEDKEDEKEDDAEDKVGKAFDAKDKVVVL